MFTQLKTHLSIDFQKLITNVLKSKFFYRHDYCIGHHREYRSPRQNWACYTRILQHLRNIRSRCSYCRSSFGAPESRRSDNSPWKPAWYWNFDHLTLDTCLSRTYESSCRYRQTGFYHTAMESQLNLHIQIYFVHNIYNFHIQINFVQNIYKEYIPMLSWE